VKTPQQALAAGATADSVSVNLTGLTKGTKYCVQLLASNSKGTNSGQAASFTTAE